MLQCENYSSDITLWPFMLDRTAFGLARELGDRAVEGQVCYSLGNLYTLLKDHAKAAEYHLLHLQIAKELNDAVGLGRAYWSLGNVYTEIGNTRKAFSFIKLHLDLSIKVTLNHVSVINYAVHLFM